MKETESLELTVNLGNRSIQFQLIYNKSKICWKLAMLSDEGRKHVAVIDQGLFEKNPSFMQGFLKSLPVIGNSFGEKL